MSTTTQAGAGPLNKIEAVILRHFPRSALGDAAYGTARQRECAAEIAALAPSAVVPEEVRRLESSDEAVFACACAQWVRTLLSTPSRRTDTPPAGGGAVDREDVRNLADAGLKLAQLASYAEIIGEIRHNRGPIREACDEVFRFNLAYQKRLDAEEDAAPAAPEPAAHETFPRGAGTGTYFRRLPDKTWVMLNSGDQWVTIAAPRWAPAPEPAAGGGRETPSSGTAAHHAHSLEIAAKVLRGLARLASADSCDKAAAFLRSILSAPSGAQDAGESWQPISARPSPDETYADLPGDAREGIGFAIDEDTEEVRYLVWWKYCGGGVSETTHWRPLPPPPTNRADTGAEGGQS